MIAAITGANGFIGQHLVNRFLEAGWETRPVVRRDFESGSLEHAFAYADVIVHAAGATRAPTHAELLASNVGLTRRVIEAARRAKAGRLVFISSQAAAGPAAARETPITEDHPPAPHEAYGRSKLEAERLVETATDLDPVIVRPAAVYGPGDKDFLTMFQLARLGIAIHPGNRDQWISIVHVDDLVRCIVAAATEAKSVGRTYFLSNDDPVQWRQLFRDAAMCARRSLAVDLELPSILVRFAAGIGDVAARLTGTAGLVTTEKLALSEPRYWICSSERAKREVGFAPQIDLGRGLRETYEWYRANHWL
ncbi:MAG TPA: NAD-dependent epimerase/dehydratase family protein [Gemmatimonadaceae bacterium]